MTEVEVDIYLDKHTKKPALAEDLSQTKGRKPSYVPERRPTARSPSRSRSRSFEGGQQPIPAPILNPGFPGLLNIMNPFAGYSQMNPNPASLYRNTNDVKSDGKRQLYWNPNTESIIEL